MINLAIIEDNAQYLATLRQYISRFGEEHTQEFHLATYVSIEDFLLPRSESYDIVFFDIELPGMNGMEGAKRFRQMDSDAVIIFVTNLSKYAVNGYEVDAMDYMLKPVSYNNLALKLQKAIQRIEKKQHKTLTLRSRDGIYKLRSKDIYFIESTGHNLTFHTDDGDVTVTGSLSDYEEELKGHSFSRCDRCYLVNMQAIAKTDGTFITLRNGAEITISRRKKKDFLSDFTQYIGG